MGCRLVESGLSIALQGDELSGGGGVFTPAASLGEVLRRCADTSCAPFRNRILWHSFGGVADSFRLCYRWLERSGFRRQTSLKNRVPADGKTAVELSAAAGADTAWAGLGCRRLVATGSSFRFLDDKSA